MLVQGKKVLVTGVLTHRSRSIGIAEFAIQEGAEVVLTSFGRMLSLTQRSAKRLPGQSDSGLQFSTTYYFTVLVKDAAGNKSAYAPVSVTTEASGDTGLSCPAGQVAVGIHGRTGACSDV
jgi:enoyl-[acyl-carrier-protein] reductase (NADH)